MSFMFSKCSSLSNVPQLNTKCVENMERMFEYCSNLIVIPNLDCSGITSHDDIKSVFENCIRLERVEFTNLKYIGEYFFNNCYSLKTIIIHNLFVTSLSEINAFNHCYHMNGTIDETYNPNGDKDCYIYVPDELVKRYKESDD